jgi:hypothetical protein
MDDEIELNGREMRQNRTSEMGDDMQQDFTDGRADAVGLHRWDIRRDGR